MKERKERKATTKWKDTTLEKEKAKTEETHLHATTAVKAIRATQEDEKAMEWS